MPRFEGRRPASERASAAARGSSRKSGTRCELKLRRALWAAGLRYRLDTDDLPGKPDLVFRGPRIALFCDGDFWHGKDWDQRKARLEQGHNAPYWVAKIERNRARDRARDLELVRRGWTVVRVWESEIHGQLERVVRQVRELVKDARGRFTPDRPGATIRPWGGS